MAFRFRKSFKLAPGVRVNLSRSGVSTTFGGRGMSVNAGRRGTYLNAGIPGTGIHGRSRIGGASGGGQGGGTAAGATAAGCAGCGVLGLLMMVLVGFCSALVSHPGDGGTSTPSIVATDTAYTAPQQRETLYAHGTMNVRSGAATTYGVVRTLSRGEAVEVGPADANGWAPVYGSYGTRIGYVYRASRKLRPEAPVTRTGPEPRANPSGATAVCRDGTYSYSAHRRGTCSHHGGVARWF